MATVTLRPSANGSQITLLPIPASQQNYQCVDESTPNTTDYVHVAESVYKRDLYDIPSSGIPAGSTINSVTVYWRARRYVILGTAGACYGCPSSRTNNATVDGTEVLLSGVWTTRSQTWNTNPVTGNAWTLDEINALEIGQKLKGYAGDSNITDAQDTQTYVVVDYTPPPAARAMLMDGLVVF